MAKRSTRPGKAIRPQSYSKGRTPPRAADSTKAAPPSGPNGRASAPRASVTPATAAATAQVDFAIEYRYVVQDLRRLFMLAGGLLIVLVVLAYFLT